MPVESLSADDVRATMDWHRPYEINGFYFCDGCLESFGRAVIWPCTHALWVRPRVTAADAEAWLREVAA